VIPPVERVRKLLVYDERYPAVPRPITVDVRFDWRPIVDTNPAVPRPMIVEVSSLGSINVLINCLRPRDVLKSCELEIYPAEPRPITVDVSCEAKCVVDTRFAKFAVETKDVRFAVETKPPIAGSVDKYPALPKPITVDVNCEAR
jgi:hypothetical protein